jgi:hypothetical protein
MSRFRIRTNGEKFTPEEVLKQKSFENFLAAYKRHTLPGNAGKIGLGIVATGVIATVILLSVKSSTTLRTDSPVTEKKVRYVEPPLNGFDTPYALFTVDAEKGGELHYKTGSVLRVPPHAFIGKDGKPVGGTVTLKYREFHDIADIFLSGIPMTYDSAGTQYHFESAGMMELLAFQGDQSLNVNPGNQIHVDLASKQTGDYFNVYYLDTNKRNWDFIKKDTAGVHYGDAQKKLDELLKSRSPEEVKNVLKKDLEHLDRKTADLEKTRPVAPLLSDKNRFKIKLDVRPDEFPEITAYENVIFQLAPEETGFRPEYAKITWDNVSVERWTEKNGYGLTFSKGKEKHTFLCRLVADEKDYPDAMNLFGKLEEKYRKLLADHKKKVLEKQKQLELVHRLLKSQNDNLNDSMKYAGVMNDSMYAMQQTIMRGFEVAKFGFWNCDCPSALPKGMIVNASFVDSTGKPLKFDDVYLVEKGRNALFTYHSYAFREFRYDPSKQNMIWAVAPGNKLAFFSVQAFKKLKVQKEGAEFTLRLVDKKFKSTDEVKAFMKI